jgi:hypothetical protein
MKKARSMLLNEEFTSDDDRLTYQSYEKLALICNVCGELVFFKQGIERVSHFSHYKDTGKNKCRWRTKSPDSTQNTDSEAKKQSLEKFQKKLQDIIDEGIIKYQKILFYQLDDGRHQRRILVARRDKGKSLVNQYKIDINSWLSRFYEEREHIKEFAKSLYHNKLSEIQRLVFSNIVHYLCLPASEDILINILYYVFFLNKEVVLNNDFEELRSKVIEIISFADWEKEYKRAKGLVETSKFEQNLLTPYVDFREYEIAPITFKGIDHPNVEEKTPKSKIQVDRQTPKPIKLENEKVVSGSVEFADIIGTIPMSLKVVPSTTGYSLVGLPVKLPDDFIYDLARYIMANLGQQQSLGYLNSEINRLKTLDCEMIGKFTRLQLIKMLNALCDGVIDGKKLDPQHILESKNRLKKYLTSHEFLSSTVDKYYSFYNLGQIAIIQELEVEKYTYLLTNFGDDRALERHNLPSVLNWLRRVTYNLSEYFGKKKPSFEEIEYYLKSTFKYRNVDLRFYQAKGMFFEIIYQGKSVAKQLITIIDPATKDKNYGVTPTKVATRIEFSDKRIFKQFLKCSDADFDLIEFAQNQLRKVVNKFLSANRHSIIGEGKTATPTKVTELAGFIDTGHNLSGIKNTFLKFIRPFTSESAVNLGKVIDLRTLKPYSQHDVTFLFEKVTINWKNWNKAKDLEITLGGQTVGKKNPAKLMLNVHNLLDRQPQLDSIVWGDMIDIFYQLSELSIGFKCSNGVILTPYSIYPTDIERWEHRIKIQLIDILYKDQLVKQTQADTVLKGALKARNDLLITQSRELVQKAKIGGVESWLQMSIAKLYQALEKSYPTWEKEVSQDVLNHLAALHDALAVCENIN